jgi:hypothetical protein
VTGEGGDVIALVRTARQCDFKEALQWLADFTGVAFTGDTQQHRDDVDSDWPGDLKRARWWRVTAQVLAEWALEELAPTDPERWVYTSLLQRIRSTDKALVNSYLEWRKRDPKFTAAMTHAGRLRSAQVQRQLAQQIMRNHAQTAA